MNNHKSKLGNTTYHYDFNSDFSGTMRIARRSMLSPENDLEIWVPAQDILDLAARYVSAKRISEIEQMETDEVLGVKS